MACDSTDCGFVDVKENTVVSTTNYGIAASSGHDISISKNRVVSSGLLPSGRRIKAQNVGIYIWNSDNDPGWGNVIGTGNMVGWVNADGRNDWYVPDATSFNGNHRLPSGTNLKNAEKGEHDIWQVKAQSNGVSVGNW